VPVDLGELYASVPRQVPGASRDPATEISAQSVVEASGSARDVAVTVDPPVTSVSVQVPPDSTTPANASTTTADVPASQAE
jgi:hypothetical protein